MEDKTTRWILLTAAAPIAWGSTYFVTRHFLPADAPVWGAVIRCLPAGLLLLLLVRRLPKGQWWWRSFVLGGLTVGGLNVLVYVAALRLPSSIAATIMSTSAAAMLLFGWLILRDRPRSAAVLGALLGIAGVVFMLDVGAAHLDAWGIAASVGAMLSSSLGFVYVVLVATVFAYAAWFNGIARLSPGTVGILGLLNPLTGVILGVILAAEPFGPPQFLGAVLVIVGVVIGVSRRTPRRPSLQSWNLDEARAQHVRAISEMWVPPTR